MLAGAEEIEEVRTMQQQIRSAVRLIYYKDTAYDLARTIFNHYHLRRAQYIQHPGNQGHSTYMILGRRIRQNT